ncbi:hypothetical protein ACFOWA_13270 [Pedobacter lithocola]|uniref:Uncharacterized protein n=1 Tax=Pedobacter lithocola TaxID=1908239 RepID=A0ABV8PA50_9SPHI
MELPDCLKLNSDIFEPKGIYKFPSELLSSPHPHYFIVVEIEGRLFHLVVCTTQFEKKKQYLAYAGIDECTLVWVKPAENNGLTQECYVNCNTVFSHYTTEDLQEKLTSGVLTYEGQISDSEYFQIMNGIIQSPNVDKSVILVIKKTFDDFNEL